MRNGFGLCLLFIGCTDYDLKNMEESAVGADGNDAPVESNGENPSDESEEDSDSPDDPNNESTEDDEECTETYITFDIEEVSTLQDAVSYSVANWSQDAVTLTFDDSNLASNQTWRVSAVEVLVLIADAYYPHFVDGQEINVQIFDSHNPNSGTVWTMTESIVRSDYTWSNYTLPNDAWYAGIYGEFQQKGTWVRFDTRTVIPSSGMASSDFLVGVMWEPPGMVKLGYSNFNQDCERNWSNYGSGWGLNSENPEFFGCSWPMMRVEVEVITTGDCE